MDGVHGARNAALGHYGRLSPMQLHRNVTGFSLGPDGWGCPMTARAIQLTKD